MFVTSERLPHLLSPTCYHAAQHYERERESVLRSAWHLVGTQCELARPGDFLTVDLFGHPVQVRNFDGELRALSNVCAHRHCLISSQPRGASPNMQCQYHGWEYDCDGRTGRIPEPKNFAPIDRETQRLPAYRVATCGQLVFVSLDQQGPDLRDHLGTLYDPCAERFGDGWRSFLTWEVDYPANWKIPIENSLEAYHVPNVHPNTFRVAPGEQRSEHILGDRHTAFGTDMPFDPHSRIDNLFQRGEGWLLRRFDERPTCEYWQHHVFPNLLFSFTDAVSLCHCVVPTSPTTSRAIVRQFGRSGKPSLGPRRYLAWLWGSVAAGVTKRIMSEDLSLFADIQHGMEASPHPGVLGRCEERLHVFQEYIHVAVNSPLERSTKRRSVELEPNYD